MVLNSPLVKDTLTSHNQETLGKQGNVPLDGGSWEHYKSLWTLRLSNEFLFEMEDIVQAPSEFNQDFSISNILEQTILSTA